MQKLCDLSELNQDQGRDLVLEIDGATRFLAIFLIGDEPRAYLNTCPHQGRSLNWTQDEFLIGKDGLLVCPHHGATFNLDSGECMEGPCQGAFLTRLETVIRDGALYLAT